MNPPDLKYSKEHEWVRLEDSGLMYIGITDHAQDSLGDVVYLDIPEEGAALAQFEKFGEIESVKAVSDLFAPISGNVLEINTLLIDAPEMVNQDPYGRGWILNVESTNAKELENLLSAAEYEGFLQTMEDE